MIWAVVMAAGKSRRMAGRHKLLIRDADGVPMVGRVVRACCESVVDGVVVVLGFGATEVRAAAMAEGVVFVEAAGFADGMSASLRAGIAALPCWVEAAVVCLGDMPLVGAEIIDRVVGGYAPGGIVVPVFGGRRGNPVLWDRCAFGAMMELEGDQGAKGLLEVFRSRVTEVEVESPGILIDFDTPESLAIPF